MTVKELIEKLKPLDPNKEVKLWQEGYGTFALGEYEDIEIIQIDNGNDFVSIES